MIYKQKYIIRRTRHKNIFPKNSSFSLSIILKIAYYAIRLISLLSNN